MINEVGQSKVYFQNSMDEKLLFFIAFFTNFFSLLSCPFVSWESQLLILLRISPCLSIHLQHNTVILLFVSPAEGQSIRHDVNCGLQLKCISFVMYVSSIETTGGRWVGQH